MRIRYCHNLEIECSVRVTFGRQHVVMPAAPDWRGTESRLSHPKMNGSFDLLAERARAKSARRGAAGGDLLLQASLRRGLGIHVDDLNAAVDRVHRRVRILRLGLAIANGDEIGAIDAVFLGEVPLDGNNTTIR